MKLSTLVFISIKHVFLPFSLRSRLITDTRIILWHVPLVSVLNGFHCSCSQTHWQVISIENQTDLIIGLVLVDDSGSKALRSLRTVFDIDRLVERLTFCQFMA